MAKKNLTDGTAVLLHPNVRGRMGNVVKIDITLMNKRENKKKASIINR